MTVKNTYRVTGSLLLALCALHSDTSIADAITASTRSMGDDGSVNVGEVSKADNASIYVAPKSAVPSQRQIFRSGLAEKVIGKKQIEAAGPGASGNEMLSMAPGVNVISGYTATGGGKTQISINGVKQGWHIPGGAIDDGSIATTFDGVPMANVATGLWASPDVNQSSLISGIRLTYGPGNPSNRWYNSIGGTINYIPLQPTKKAGAAIGMSYGSYDFKNIHFAINTGEHDGFAAVIGGGSSSGNSYLSAPAGSIVRPFGSSNMSSYSYSWYFKGIKTFTNGNVSLGAYLAKGQSYKPFMQLLSPIEGITINGQDAHKKPIPGPLYSQQTSGFYGALPYKDDSNTVWMLYQKTNVDIGAGTELHNMVWFRHGDRLHYQISRFYPEDYEYYTPHTNVYGDKLSFVTHLPWNELEYGGYFINERYTVENNNFPYGAYDPAAAFKQKYLYKTFDSTALAAYLQDRISPIESLDITPGVRVVGYQTRYTPNMCAESPEACALDPKGEESSLPASSKSYEQVEPSLAINWRPMQHLALFASYAVAYKTPGAADDGGGVFQSIPTSALSLEKGQEYQAGMKFHVKEAPYLHNFLASVNWYFLHFSNQFIPITLPDNSVINAQGTSDYDGVNISLEDDPIYWLHLFTNLSFEKANFTHYALQGGKSYNGLPLPYVPSQTANVGFYTQNYVAGVDIEPRLWMTYTGPQAIFDSITNAPSPDIKMPAFTLVNFSLGAKVPVHFIGLNYLSSKLEIMNLLGKKYNRYVQVDSGSSGQFGPLGAGALVGYAGAPRLVYFSVSAKF
ncbi:TonB-dependent receptor [Acidithiobacillus sulfurivorans]|uniref:TonB-dependent receptor n=1 Tax=Acidithiobacillus sulfurivorans TaxID=1958756 RepID=A0ABS5ZU41_9PROT|nr:TonB-dependent receptor [Acidithiobacillus sulfurivorans]MBU2758723.1 TonB-dependent receptor [Acidithiobacillus sulfurivorans]